MAGRHPHAAQLASRHGSPPPMEAMVSDRACLRLFRGHPFRRAAAVLVAFALSAPAGAAAQVLAQAVPSRYDLELAPGRRESRPLFLYNLGRESVKVRLRLADLRMSERGALDLHPPGTLGSTLEGVVEIPGGELMLEPGERRALPLKMTMPGDGLATRCGVVLCRVTSAKPHAATGVPSTPAELGTTLFLTRAARSSIRADMVSLDASVTAAGRVAVNVRLRNRSPRHAPCSGEVKLVGATGAPVVAGFLRDGVVLPGADRILDWRSETRLSPGRYVVTVTVDVGVPELLVGQKEIVVGRRGPSAARNE